MLPFLCRVRVICPTDLKLLVGGLALYHVLLPRALSVWRPMVWSAGLYACSCSLCGPFRLSFHIVHRPTTKSRRRSAPFLLLATFQTFLSFCSVVHRRPSLNPRALDWAFVCHPRVSRRFVLCCAKIHRGQTRYLTFLECLHFSGAEGNRASGSAERLSLLCSHSTPKAKDCQALRYVFPQLGSHYVVLLSALFLSSCSSFLALLFSFLSLLRIEPQKRAIINHRN